MQPGQIITPAQIASLGTATPVNQPTAPVPGAPAAAPVPANNAPTPQVGAVLTPAQILALGKATPVPGKSLNPLSNTVDAAVAGANQGGTGINEVFQGTDEANKGNVAKGLTDVGKGALDVVSGGVSELFSPISGLMTSLAHIPVANSGGLNVGDLIQKNGIQPIADVISDAKPLQDFMANNPDADKVAANLINIGLALGGGAKAPEIKGAISDAADATAEAAKNVVAPINDIANQISKQFSIENPTAGDLITKRVAALQQIENNSGPVRRIVNDATNRGIDVKNLVANTDLLQGSVDENGNLSTLKPGEAVDQFNQFMGKYESAVSDALAKEGKSIPVSDVEKMLTDRINSSNIAGGSKTRITNLINGEIQGLKLDATPDGMIPLSKLQDAKISTTDGIDYTNLGSKKYAKIIANTYKTAIENNSSLPVKEVNADLSKYYKIGDYLEGLNGRKVAGGRLGKYFAQTVGAITGAHFGPLGSIIGAELASKIKGSLMESTFKGSLGKDLQASAAVKDMVMKNQLPRTALPAPKEGAAKVHNNVPIIAGPESSIEAPAGSVNITNSKAVQSVAQLVEKSQLKAAEKTALLKFLNEPYVDPAMLPVIEAGIKKAAKSKLPVIKG